MMNYKCVPYRTIFFNAKEHRVFIEIRIEYYIDIFDVNIDKIDLKENSKKRKYIFFFGALKLACVKAFNNFVKMKNYSIAIKPREKSTLRFRVRRKYGNHGRVTT